MKTCTIVGGVNGVGKTSFTGVLKELTTDLGMIIDENRITVDLGGNSLTGGNAAQKKIHECISKGVSFTQETPLSGCQTEATIKEVKALGYHVRLFYIGLDTVGESLQRIENRVKRGGHNIPHDVVTRCFEGRRDAVAKVLPYCDEAEFYDNNNGFVMVAVYRNGEFRKVRENTCAWIDELGAYLKTHIQPIQDFESIHRSGNTGQ